MAPRSIEMYKGASPIEDEECVIGKLENQTQEEAEGSYDEGHYDEQGYVEDDYGEAEEEYDESSVPGRTVKFKHTTKVFFVLGQWEMSQEEIDSTWLTKDDLNESKDEMSYTVRAIRSGMLNEDEHCARGLEHLKDARCLEKRKMHKDTVIHAVLKEQRKQRILGIYDDNALSEVSASCSKWARDQGFKLGAYDAVKAHKQDKGTGKSDTAMGIFSRINRRSSWQCGIIPNDQCLLYLGEALHVSDSEGSHFKICNKARRKKENRRASWDLSTMNTAKFHENLAALKARNSGRKGSDDDGSVIKRRR